VLDFVLGHVWLYEDGSNRYSVKIQIAQSQGHELTNSQACIEHQQGHAVITDRLALFLRSGGMAEQRVKEFYAFLGFQCGRLIGAHG